LSKKRVGFLKIVILRLISFPLSHTSTLSNKLKVSSITTYLDAFCQNISFNLLLLQLLLLGNDVAKNVGEVSVFH
jgi:hypothetical protein